MIHDEGVFDTTRQEWLLKDRLQLGNMWQSDHLSRKRAPREFARVRESATNQGSLSLCLSLSLRYER